LHPLGDAALLWRACSRLGISADAAAPAVQAGLLKAGWRVTFFHPPPSAGLRMAGNFT